MYNKENKKRQEKKYKEEDIKHVIVAKRTFNGATVAGKMYACISNWRGLRITYIGENNVVYSSRTKEAFIRSPRSSKYLKELLTVINSDNSVIRAGKQLNLFNL